jgi:hypothetical protein
MCSRPPPVLSRSEEVLGLFLNEGQYQLTPKKENVVLCVLKINIISVKYGVYVIDAEGDCAWFIGL